MLIVDVDNRLRFPRLEPEVLDALKRAFTHENPTRKKAEARLRNLPDKGIPPRVRGALYAALKAEPKYIATWLEDERGFSLPRGGLIRAREVLEDFGLEMATVDHRTEGDPTLRHDHEHLLELRDYQRTIGAAIDEVEQGLVRSSTGSGKTTAMIAAAAFTGLPTLFVVHTGALLEQWVRRLRTELGLEAKDVGIIGGGKKILRPLTVGLLQSCTKIAKELAPIFGFIAADEVHLYAAKTFLGFIDHMTARYRIGVSDDERRKDQKEFLIHDMFGEIIANVDRSKLVADGRIFDVEIRLFRTGYAPRWYLETPEQARPNVHNELLDDMIADADRNAQIVKIAIAEMRAGEQVLIWSHRVAHCERMRADLAAHDPRVGLLLGGPAMQTEYQRTLLGILDGSIAAAVGTYKAVGTGIDVPSIGRGIATTPIHNNRGFVNQVRGRICRRQDGKGDAILFYPWDEACFGLAPVEKLASLAKVAKVLEAGEWVDAKPWLKAAKERRREEREAGR